MSFFETFLECGVIPSLQEFGATFESEELNNTSDFTNVRKKCFKDLQARTEAMAQQLLVDARDQLTASSGQEVVLFRPQIINGTHILYRVEDQFLFLESLVATPTNEKQRKMKKASDLVEFWCKRVDVLEETKNNLDNFWLKQLDIARRKELATLKKRARHQLMIARANKRCLQSISGFLTPFLTASPQKFADSLKTLHVFIRLLFSVAESTHWAVSYRPFLDLCARDFVRKARQHILFGTTDEEIRSCVEEVITFRKNLIDDEERMVQAEGGLGFSKRRLGQEFEDASDEQLLDPAKAIEKLHEDASMRLADSGANNERGARSKTKSKGLSIFNFDSKNYFRNEEESRSDDREETAENELEEDFIGEGGLVPSANDSTQEEFERRWAECLDSIDNVSAEEVEKELKREQLEAYSEAVSWLSRTIFGERELAFRAQAVSVAAAQLKETVLRCHQRTSDISQRKSAAKTTTTTTLTTLTSSPTASSNESDRQIHAPEFDHPSGIEHDADLLETFQLLDNLCEQCSLISSFTQLFSCIHPISNLSLTGPSSATGVGILVQIRKEFLRYSHVLLHNPFLFFHKIATKRKRRVVQLFADDISRYIGSAVVELLTGTSNISQAVVIIMEMLFVVDHPLISETVLNKREGILSIGESCLAAIVEAYKRTLSPLSIVPSIPQNFTQLMALHMLKRQTDIVNVFCEVLLKLTPNGSSIRRLLRQREQLAANKNAASGLESHSSILPSSSTSTYSSSASLSSSSFISRISSTSTALPISLTSYTFPLHSSDPSFACFTQLSIACTEDIMRLLQQVTELSSSIQDSYSKRLTSWLHTLEVYQKDQFQESCFVQQRPGVLESTVIQMEQYASLLRVFHISQGFVSSMPIQAQANARQLEQLLVQRQRLEYFISEYLKFHRTVKPLYVQWLHTSVKVVDQLVERGLTAVTWQSVELVPFISECLESLAVLQKELRLLKEGKAAFESELLLMKQTLVFQFPETVLMEEEFESEIDAAISKKQEEVRIYNVHLEHIKYNIISSIKGATDEATMNEFFEKLQEKKRSVLRSFVNTTLKYALSRISSETAMIEIPLMIKGNVLVLNLHCAKDSNQSDGAVAESASSSSPLQSPLRIVSSSFLSQQQTPHSQNTLDHRHLQRQQLYSAESDSAEDLNLVQLFDNLIGKLMEIVDDEEMAETQVLTQQLSTELIELERRCIHFCNELMSNYSFMWTNSSNEAFSRFVALPLHSSEEPTIPRIPQSFIDLLKAAQAMQKEKIEWSKQHLPSMRHGASALMKNAISGTKVENDWRWIDGSSGGKGDIDGFKAGDGGKLVNPPLREWTEQINSIQRMNDGIKGIAEKVSLGWVLINTSAFKQELFSLASQWVLPFTKFMADGVADVTRRWVSLQNRIHQIFDPSFTHFSIRQKIEVIHTTRKATEGVVDVDAFFAKLKMRLTCLQKVMVYCPHQLTSQVTEAERMWRTFKRMQLESYTDHIQAMERDVLSEITTREQALKQDISLFMKRLTDPSIAPLTLSDKLDKEHIESTLFALNEESDALQVKAEDIKRLHELFTQRESEGGWDELKWCTRFIDKLIKLWGLVFSTRQMMNEYLFNATWREFCSDPIPADYFMKPEEVLMSAKDELSNFSLYNDFKKELIGYSKSFKVLNMIKQAPVEERHWSELLEQMEVSDAESLLNQAQNGTLKMSTLFTICTEAAQPGIEVVLEKCRKQAEILESIEVIEARWNLMALPLVVDSNTAESTDECAGTEDEAAADYALDTSKTADKKRKAKQRDKKEKKSTKQRVSFPEVDVSQSNGMIFQANNDLMSLMNLMTSRHSDYFVNMLLHSLQSVSEIEIFLENLLEIHKAATKVKAGIVYGIIIHKDPATEAFLNHLSSLAIEVRKIRDFSDPAIVSLKSQFEEVVKESRLLLIDAPNHQMIQIASQKPHFLRLTASELIDYASAFLKGEKQLTLPAGILNQFIPGAHQVIFEMSGDGHTLHIPFIADKNGVKLIYDDEDVILDRDIWALPEILLNANRKILQKELATTVQSLDSEPTFFNWFSNLMSQYDIAERYPIHVQVFVIAIRVWYSRRVQKAADLCAEENYEEMTQTMEETRSELLRCFWHLVTLQRLSFPIGRERHIVDIIRKKEQNEKISLNVPNKTGEQSTVAVAPQTSEKEMKEMIDSRSTDAKRNKDNIENNSSNAAAAVIDKQHIDVFNSFDDEDDDDFDDEIEGRFARGSSEDSSHSRDEIGLGDFRYDGDEYASQQGDYGASVFPDNRLKSNLDSQMVVQTYRKMLCGMLLLFISFIAEDQQRMQTLKELGGILTRDIVYSDIYGLFAQKGVAAQHSKASYTGNFGNAAPSKSGSSLFSDEEWKFDQIEMTDLKWHGMINQHALKKLMLNRVMCEFNEKERNAYFVVAFSDTSLDQNEKKTRFESGLEWIPSYQCLPRAPNTRSAMFLSDTILASFCDSTKPNARICGPCLMTEDTTHVLAKCYFLDTVHSLNRNVYVFQCTPLTDSNDIKKYLVTTMVDAGFVLIEGLELLQPLVRRSLADFLQDLWRWRNMHQSTQSGFVQMNLEGLKTQIKLPLSDWVVTGLFRSEDGCNGVLPDSLEMIFTPIVMPHVETEYWIKCQLAMQGFTQFTGLSQKISTFLDAFIKLLPYEFSQTQNQAQAKLISIQFLEGFASEAGDLMRQLFFEREHKVNANEENERDGKFMRWEGVQSVTTDGVHLFLREDVPLLEELACRVTLTKWVDSIFSTLIPMALIDPVHTSNPMADDAKLALPPLLETVHQLLDSSFPETAQKSNLNISSFMNSSSLNFSSAIPSSGARSEDRIIRRIDAQHVPASFTGLCYQIAREIGVAMDDVLAQKCWEAYRISISSWVLFLNGPPGCGKNTIIKILSSLFHRNSPRQLQPRVIYLDLSVFTTNSPDVSIRRETIMNFLCSRISSELRRSEIDSTGDPSIGGSTSDEESSELAPIWIVVPALNPLSMPSIHSCFQQLFMCCISEMNNAIEFNFSHFERLVLPLKSKLIYSVSCSQFEIVPSLAQFHPIVSVQFSSLTVLNWIFESWAKNSGDCIPSEYLESVILLLRLSIQKCLNYLRFVTFSCEHFGTSRIPVIGLIQTTVSIFTSLTILYNRHFSEKLHMGILKLFIVYSVMWGMGGHLKSRPVALDLLEQWHSHWKKHHPIQKILSSIDNVVIGVSSSQSATASHVVKMESPLVDDERAKKSDIIWREDFDVWFRGAFEKEAEFGKSGTIFEYIVDPVHHQMVHISDATKWRHVLDYLDLNQHVPLLLQHFIPFLQISYVSALCSFAGRPVLLLDDLFIEFTRMSACVGDVLTTIQHEFLPFSCAWTQICSAKIHHPVTYHVQLGHLTNTAAKDYCTHFIPLGSLYTIPMCPTRTVLITISDNRRLEPEWIPHKEQDVRRKPELLSAAVNMFHAQFCRRFVFDSETKPRTTIHQNPIILTANNESYFSFPENVVATNHYSTFVIPHPTIDDFIAIGKEVWNNGDMRQYIAQCPPADNVGMPRVFGGKELYDFYFGNVIPATINFHLLMLNKDKGQQMPTLTMFVNVLRSITNSNNAFYQDLELLAALWLWECKRIYIIAQPTMRVTLILREMLETVYESFFGSNASEASRYSFAPFGGDGTRFTLPLLLDTKKKTTSQTVQKVYARLAELSSDYTSYSLHITSCLCHSVDFTNAVLMMMESLVESSYPIFASDTDGHLMCLLFDALSFALGINLSQARFPANHSTVKRFLDSLAKFIVGAGSLQPTYGFSDSASIEQSLSGTSATATTVVSPSSPCASENVPTSSTSSSSSSSHASSRDILLRTGWRRDKGTGRSENTSRRFGMKHQSDIESIFLVHLGKPSAEFHILVNVLNCVFIEGAIPNYMKSGIVTPIGADDDSLLETITYDNVLLYVIGRVTDGLAQLGRSNVTGTDIDTIIKNVSLTSRVVLYSIEHNVCYTRPFFQMMQRMTFLYTSNTSYLLSLTSSSTVSASNTSNTLAPSGSVQPSLNAFSKPSFASPTTASAIALSSGSTAVLSSSSSSYPPSSPTAMKKKNSNQSVTTPTSIALNSDGVSPSSSSPSTASSFDFEKIPVVGVTIRVLLSLFNSAVNLSQASDSERSIWNHVSEGNVGSSFFVGHVSLCDLVSFSEFFSRLLFFTVCFYQRSVVYCESTISLIDAFQRNLEKLRQSLSQIQVMLSGNEHLNAIKKRIQLLQNTALHKMEEKYKLGEEKETLEQKLREESNRGRITVEIGNMAAEYLVALKEVAWLHPSVLLDFHNVASLNPAGRKISDSLFSFFQPLPSNARNLQSLSTGQIMFKLLQTDPTQISSAALRDVTQRLSDEVSENDLPALNGVIRHLLKWLTRMCSIARKSKKLKEAEKKVLSIMLRLVRTNVLIERNKQKVNSINCERDVAEKALSLLQQGSTQTEELLQKGRGILIRTEEMYSGMVSTAEKLRKAILIDKATLATAIGDCIFTAANFCLTQFFNYEIRQLFQKDIVIGEISKQHVPIAHNIDPLLVVGRLDFQLLSDAFVALQQFSTELESGDCAGLLSADMNVLINQLIQSSNESQLRKVIPLFSNEENVTEPSLERNETINRMDINQQVGFDMHQPVPFEKQVSFVADSFPVLTSPVAKRRQRSDSISSIISESSVNNVRLQHVPVQIPSLVKTFRAHHLSFYLLSDEIAQFACPKIIRFSDTYQNTRSLYSRNFNASQIEEKQTEQQFLSSYYALSANASQQTVNQSSSSSPSPSVMPSATLQLQTLANTQNQQIPTANNQTLLQSNLTSTSPAADVLSTALNSSAFYSYSGAQRNMCDLLSFILFSRSFFHEMLSYDRLFVTAGFESSIQNPVFPRTSLTIKIPLIIDPYEIITSKQEGHSPEANNSVFTLYGIKNPTTSPFIISLKKPDAYLKTVQAVSLLNLSALQSISHASSSEDIKQEPAEEQKLFEEQNDPKTAAGFTTSVFPGLATSPVSVDASHVPSLIIQSDSTRSLLASSDHSTGKLKYSMQKPEKELNSEKRNCIILCDVNDTTMTPQLEHFFASFAFHSGNHEPTVSSPIQAQFDSLNSPIHPGRARADFSASPSSSSSYSHLFPSDPSLSHLQNDFTTNMFSLTMHSTGTYDCFNPTLLPPFTLRNNVDLILIASKDPDSTFQGRWSQLVMPHIMTPSEHLLRMWLAPSVGKLISTHLQQTTARELFGSSNLSLFPNIGQTIQIDDLRLSFLANLLVLVYEVAQPAGSPFTFQNDSLFGDDDDPNKSKDDESKKLSKESRATYSDLNRSMSFDSVSDTSTELASFDSELFSTTSIILEKNDEIGLKGSNASKADTSLVVPFVMLTLWNQQQYSDVNERFVQFQQRETQLTDAESRLINSLRWLLFCFTWEANFSRAIVDNASIYGFCALRMSSLPFGELSPRCWMTRLFSDIIDNIMSIVKHTISEGDDSQENYSNATSMQQLDTSMGYSSSAFDSSLEASSIESSGSSSLLSDSSSPTSQHSLFRDRSSDSSSYTTPRARFPPLRETEQQEIEICQKRMMKLQHLMDCGASPIGLTDELRITTMQRITSSFWAKTHRESSSMADYFSLVLFAALQLSENTRDSPSPIERDALLYPATLLLHETSAVSNSARNDDFNFLSQAVSFLEFSHLNFPVQTAALQSAGLIPINPVPSWLPLTIWKNIFTLSTICPVFRPLISDLDPHSHAIFSFIDHLPINTKSTKQTMLRIVLETNVSNQSRQSKLSRHASLEASQRRLLTSMHSQELSSLNQLFQIANQASSKDDPLSMKLSAFRGMSISSIYLGTKSRMPLEELDVSDVSDSSARKHPFRKENYAVNIPFSSSDGNISSSAERGGDRDVLSNIPHVTKPTFHSDLHTSSPNELNSYRNFNRDGTGDAFGSNATSLISSLSSSSSPSSSATSSSTSANVLFTNSQRKWAEWFNEESPERVELPNAQLQTLTVFQRLLLIIAFRPDRTIPAMLAAIDSQPQLGLGIAFFHGSMPSIVSSSIATSTHIPQAFSASSEILLPSSYFYTGALTLEWLVDKIEASPRSDHVYVPQTTAELSVISLALQSYGVTLALSERRVIFDISRVAVKRGVALRQIHLSEHFRAAKFRSEIKRKKSVRISEEQIWNEAWTDVEEELDKGTKAKEWIVFSGLYLAPRSFIQKLCEWGNRTIKRTSFYFQLASRKRQAILWLLFPEAEYSDPNSALNSFHGDIICNSKKMFIRIPVSFRGTLAASLTAAVMEFDPQRVNDIVKHYEPNSVKDGQTSRYIVHLLFLLVCFHSLLVEYIRVQSRNRGQTKVMVYTESVFTILDLVAGIVDQSLGRRSRSGADGGRDSSFDSWMWSSLHESILTRVYPYLMGHVDVSVIKALMAVIIHPDRFAKQSASVISSSSASSSASSSTSYSSYSSSSGRDNLFSVYSDIPAPVDEMGFSDLSQHLSIILRPSTAIKSNGVLESGSGGMFSFVRMSELHKAQTVIQLCLANLIGSTEKLSNSVVLAPNGMNFDIDSNSWEMQPKSEQMMSNVRCFLSPQQYYLTSSRFMCLISSSQMLFHPAFVLRLCDEVKEIFPLKLFNIPAIMQAVTAICLSEKDIPPVIISLLREMNLVNCVISRIHSFVDHLPSFWSLSQLSASKYASNRFSMPLEDAVLGSEYIITTSMNQLLNINLASRSTSFIQSWNHLSRGETPLEWLTLSPTNKSIMFSSSTDPHLPLLLPWTNYLLGVIEQLHRLFSFIPTSHRVVQETDAPLSTPSLLAKGEIALKSSLAIQPDFLVEPEAFLVSMQLEATNAINFCIAIKSQMNEDSMHLQSHRTRDRFNRQNTSLHSSRIRQLPLPFTFAFVHPKANSYSSSSSSSAAANSSFVSALRTNKISARQTLSTGASSLSMYPLVCFSDLYMLLLPTHIQTFDSIPLNQAASMKIRSLSSLYWGGVRLASSPNSEYSLKEMKMYYSRSSDDVPSAFATASSSSSALSSINTDNRSFAAEQPSQNDRRVNLVPRSQHHSRKTLDFSLQNISKFIVSLCEPDKINTLNGISSPMATNEKMMGLPFLRMIICIRLTNNTFCTLNGNPVDDSLLQSSNILRIPLSARNFFYKIKNSILAIREESTTFQLQGMPTSKATATLTPHFDSFHSFSYFKLCSTS
ncbi:dynein haevy chain, unidentified [Monocercomonoides exilis]|uniref:dynein haevy chain, unidentified n=1 Tax=Monocercomonoides exilis TaxID=2049356 RepID=UPI0035595873|nr:dynein haevy chain, unidentified [Monocercomonoides exilis]|eukprot:MONOS_11199.1-p1 / transcript=MONOS_11199.1 / gene=MONOS_11199 / organism=Monocercomonoides_exilis_PA203 / gene_product= dynein haevy chain, unidentified / transcript_product= dynein haevy chain, unidentified / location=Mono_scaffold00549:16618-38153(-) / protein_length=7119 / sequence_SO=supercontig / SO=protein_coding / is_pseudo=false